MGNKIHCFLVDEEYGARVSNIEMYDSIRFDFTLKICFIFLSF